MKKGWGSSQARIGFECRLVKDFPTLKECCGLLSILANVALLKMSQRQMISFLLLTDFLSMLLPKLQPSKQMNLKWCSMKVIYVSPLPFLSTFHFAVGIYEKTNGYGGLGLKFRISLVTRYSRPPNFFSLSVAVTSCVL